VPDSLGLSFMPGEAGAADPNKPQPTPVQQAIQTLSLRIPRTVGAASGVPQQLLTSGGGSMLGNPNAAALLEQLRRFFMGGGNLGTPGGPVPPGGAPPMGGLPGAPIPPGGGAPGGPPPVRLPPRIDVGDPTPGQAPANDPPPAQPMGGVPSGPSPIFDRGPRPRQI